MNLTQTERDAQSYYQATQSIYENWGGYQDRPGLYALHSGYHSKGQEDSMTHKESLIEMERRILEWIQVPDNSPCQIGDFGCGVGGMTALLASTYPHSRVLGITVTDVQAEIGQAYLDKHDIQNAQITNATYMQLPCPSEHFDKIVFIESLMYAPNKRDALQEAARTLKKGGLIHFQDPVLKRPPVSETERKAVQTLCQGFSMPTFENPIDLFLSQWEEAGLQVTRVEELTPYVYPSAVLISSHAQMRHKEKPNAEEHERIRRLGGIVLEGLMKDFESENNLVGYYMIQATKDWSSLGADV